MIPISLVMVMQDLEAKCNIMIKLLDILNEAEEQQYPPFMYSPVGFSCKVCKFLNYNKDEDRWVCANTNYQKYMQSLGVAENRSHYILDPETKEPIKDPAKWCSNWFLPKSK